MGDTWPPGHAPYSLNLEHEVFISMVLVPFSEPAVSTTLKNPLFSFKFILYISAQIVAL